MMGDQSPQRQRREPFKPLAPYISSSPSPLRNSHHEALTEQQIRRLRKCVTWCGCITAIIALMAVIVIVLGFTVYNVKEPEVRMVAVTLLNGSLPNGVFNSTTNGNVTLLADMSVKNTNAFTFRFGETTTNLFYDGEGIGQGTTPAGKAKARRTLRFNVTMTVMPAKVMENPQYESDIGKDSAVNISSYTRIDGRVKIFEMFKRKVVVELNCTIEYNVTNGVITNGDNCLRLVTI